MIKIAMNGGRSKADNPAIPVSVEEYAREIAWFMKQGVSMFHIHFRNAEGEESLQQKEIEPQFRQLKERFPACRIGIGSPLQNGMTAEKRHELVAEWTWSPDFISLNLSEKGSLELVPVLREKQIPIEFGIFSMQDAKAFVDNNLEPLAHRALIEMVFASSPAQALADALEIENFLHSAYPGLELLFHAENLPTWAVLARARDQGKNWRIGLEDTLLLPDGRQADGNRELYLAALEVAPQ